MKSNISILMTATLLFAALATPIQLAAQEHAHYKLIDLGTFGGPQSYVNIPNDYAAVLNDGGVVAGWADTSTMDPYPNFCFNEDCFVSHAFQSHAGVRTDLGALVDGVSSQSTWISANGLIAGTSQNGETDPLFPGFPENQAVLWRNGHITDLGTLPEGGYESGANAVNSKGQVIGWATNTIPDPYSMIAPGFLPTQTRAFLRQGGVMQDLGTLGTGTDAEALLINEQEQIVGVSYTNSAPSSYCAQNLGFSLTTDAFLWQKGNMTDLGNFGGTCTVPTDLNNQGEVVGISTLPGDQFQHAFLWKHGSLNDLPNTSGGNNGSAIALNNAGDAVGWVSLPGDQDFHAALWRNATMTDLGTVDGDPCSVGSSINATEQVIGVSAPACDFSQTRAVLWQKGSMVDLNTLIPADSSLYLTFPETISDRGEIAGVGVDISTGNQHAFLLIPCSSDDTACQDAPAGVAFRPATAITKSANDQNNAIRRMLRRGLGPMNKVRVPNTSSEPGSNIDAPAVETAATKTSPPLLESLDAGIRFSTTSSCALYGRPCSPNGRYPRCCGTLKCAFHGGSTRVGYMRE